MDEDASQTRARSFGAVAAEYHRYRPSFPPEALVWALGTEPLDVVDVGAGTGLMTEVLRALGHRVTAVEPDDQMRAELSRHGGVCRVLTGSAEAVPLDDQSVDVVVAAESYHWFGHDRALPEFTRILRPRGALVLVWNVGDNSVPWVNDLQIELRALNPAPPGGTGRAAITSPQFGPVEEAEFRFVHVTDVDGLVGMIGTWSPVSVNPDRGRLLDQLREFLASHPDLGDGSRIEVPYRTRVLRFRKGDRPW